MIRDSKGLPIRDAIIRCPNEDLVYYKVKGRRKIIRDLLLSGARGRCCSPRDRRKRLDHLIQLINLLKKLKNYGVQFEAEFFIAKNEFKQETVYALISWIYYPYRLSRLVYNRCTKSRKKLRIILDGHYLALARYIYDHHPQNGHALFLWDIFYADQYLYGYTTSKKSGRKQIFLVDLELYHHPTRDAINGNALRELASDIGELRDMYDFKLRRTYQWFKNHPDQRVVTLYNEYLKSSHYY